MNTLLTTLSAATVEEFTRAGYWRDTTIYSAVREQADREPDGIAVQERQRETSYSQLMDAGDRLASALSASGLAAGDRVAIWLPSRSETVAAVLACARNGYVATPSLHRAHTIGEVVEMLDRVRAKALIAEEGYGADADSRSLSDAVSTLDELAFVHVLQPASTEPAFAELTGGPLPAVATDANRVAYLAFTSGSTGRSKGVMHSHNTLLAPVRALATDWSLDRNSCIYTLSPLSHNLGFGAMILALTIGAKLVIHDLPRGDSLAHRLRQTGATFVFGVPTHAIDLLAELRASGERLELRGFRISGAAAPRAVVQGLLEAGVTPQSGYGMTEAGSHNYTLPDDAPDVIVDSSGRACAGFEIKVVDRENPEKDMPIGEVGMLASRGASLMLGYFDDQLETEKSFTRDGWFLTGDLGWIDAQDYVRVTGRKKDVIIRGGHNVFPAKIENLLLRHPAVKLAAAVPQPDERLGERVCLVVEFWEGQTAEAMELLGFLDEAGLSKYDMPEFFATTPALPTLPSGKVFKRRVLEEIANDEITVMPVRFEGGQ